MLRQTISVFAAKGSYCSQGWQNKLKMHNLGAFYNDPSADLFKSEIMGKQTKPSR